MPSGGQLRLAQAIRKDNKSRKEDAKNAESQMKKQGVFGGWGRGLLGLAGGLLAGPAGAGIGSWLGTKGGEALAGEVEDARDTNFGIGATEDLNDSISGYRRNANTMAVGRGITDAFSAYVAPEMLNKGREKIAKWGADKPQYLGDWGSKQLGIGGDKFANRISGETLSDPRNSWLNAEKGLSEEQINDLFWSQGANTSSPIPSNSSSVAPNSAISNTPPPPMSQRAIINQHLNNKPVLSPVPAQTNVLSQAVNQNNSPFLQNINTYKSPESIRMQKWKEHLANNNNLAQQLTGGRK